jgi:hypothetical protein
MEFPIDLKPFKIQIRFIGFAPFKIHGDLEVRPKMKVVHLEVIYHHAKFGEFWSSRSPFFIFYNFELV